MLGLSIFFVAAAACSVLGSFSEWKRDRVRSIGFALAALLFGFLTLVALTANGPA